jgi:hypothetical protein
MNSRSVLGDAMPTGGRRLVWNILMITGTGIASFASVWGLYGRTWGPFKIGTENIVIPIGSIALATLAIMLAVGVFSFLRKQR